MLPAAAVLVALVLRDGRAALETPDEVLIICAYVCEQLYRAVCRCRYLFFFFFKLWRSTCRRQEGKKKKLELKIAREARKHTKKKKGGKATTTITTTTSHRIIRVTYSERKRHQEPWGGGGRALQENTSVFPSPSSPNSPKQQRVNHLLLSSFFFQINRPFLRG